MFYRIKKIYRYTSVVVVEADDVKTAFDLSGGVDDDPEYECWLDCELISQSTEPIEE